MANPEMFSDEWYEDDFVAPLAKGDRAALRLKLEQESRMGRMFMPGGEQHREVLQIRLRMIEMIDSESVKHAVA